jgi:acylphosphatase
MNLDDGDVEAEIEGETTTVDALIKALRKGPSVARVSDLSLTALTPTGVNTGFRVRHR